VREEEPGKSRENILGKGLRMRKLRYIAPGVIAAGLLVGEAVAVPAMAATSKSAGCTNDELCLYYSHGKGSAIWKTDYVSVCSLGPYHFTDGTGSGDPVRNDAHSYNTSKYGYFMWSKVDTEGTLEYLSPETPSGTYSAVSLDAGMRNNESSYSIGNFNC
jgi:hypothetical protein